MWWRSWRKRALVFYSQFVEQGSLCFDIGANIGNRTELFAELGATVVAVEPQANCVAKLNKRYAKSKQVRIIQKVVGPCEGEAVLQVCDRDNGRLSSCSEEWISASKSIGSIFSPLKWERSIKVPMTTLDSLIAQFGMPSFCKIDVEGFEYEVIKGLTQPIKAVSLEFATHHLPPAVDSIRRLAELGLTGFNYSMGESTEWALPKFVSADEICNILRKLPEKLAYGDVYATT
jgi:FkbM family methyltransferase